MSPNAYVHKDMREVRIGKIEVKSDGVALTIGFSIILFEHLHMNFGNDDRKPQEVI